VLPPDLHTIRINSAADPRIADYADLKEAQLRQLAADPASPPTGVFIAEGELVVRQLVASRLAVRSLLLTPQRLTTMRDALERLRPGTPIYLADQTVMNRIVGFNIHRGILAAGVRPSPPPLDGLLMASASLVVLEDLANHDNVGGIFRAAAALGGIARPETDGPPRGCSVLLSPRCCDPLYRKAIRVSMGTVLHLSFARLTPWPDALGRIEAAGFTLVALTPATDAVPIDQLPQTAVGRPALLLGAEGPGLSPAAMAAALRVRIPLDRHVDSLNVVVAAGIALHRLARPDR
jgi:tRNA G18 (ribose-2'-O)-methylase SpoU